MNLMHPSYVLPSIDTQCVSASCASGRNANSEISTKIIAMIPIVFIAGFIMILYTYIHT